MLELQQCWESQITKKPFLDEADKGPKKVKRTSGSPKLARNRPLKEWRTSRRCYAPVTREQRYTDNFRHGAAAVQNSLAFVPA